MSKKFLIITIAIVLGLFLISLIGYYFILQGNGSGTNGTPSVFQNFFPFGGNGTSGTSTPVVETQIPQPQKNFTAKLRKLSSEEVSGAGIVDVKAGSVVRYIEKATGHIFEVELFSPSQNRISNTTIPLVAEAFWGNENNSLIARYLKDDNQTIDTYSLSIKQTATTSENMVSAIIFPPNISDISVLGNSVFYLQQSDTFSVGYISNFNGGNKKQIWNSPIKELLSQYFNARTVALTTKPAPNVPGFLYFIDTGTGQVKKILGDILGLSTRVNDTGTQVVYLEEGNGVAISLFDIKTKSSTKLSPTTFPEKCAWSKKDKNIIYCAVPREILDGNSLTSWYKGQASFTDDIWKYDLKNNNSGVIENLTNESSTLIDVINPTLSPNEQYLVFMNKADNTLWSLDLTK